MHSHWDQLFRIACSLIDQVNRDQPIIQNWTLGGGTALMLQIGHRVSFDIDIFLDNPQQLGFLDLSKNSFQFELEPSAFAGDGARFMKIAFENVGEIDFVASPILTQNGFSSKDILGRIIPVETPAEIIAKKIFYRGASATPRDIFDIAAASRDHRHEIILALRHFPEKIEQSLEAIMKTNRNYIDTVISDLQILPEYEKMRQHSTGICQDLLSEALQKTE